MTLRVNKGLRSNISTGHILRSELRSLPIFEKCKLDSIHLHSVEIATVEEEQESQPITLTAWLHGMVTP